MQLILRSEWVACRMFWPKEVWGRYGGSLEDFKAPANAAAAIACLNELVTDALRCAVPAASILLSMPDTLRGLPFPNIWLAHRSSRSLNMLD